MPPKPTPKTATDAVKASLTAGTCASTTVGLLQQTLFGTVKSHSATTTTAAKTASRKKTAAASEPLLSVAERYRLAIEVVNACLKAFSTAAKNPTRPDALESSKDAPLPRPRKTGKLASVATRPLQPRSMNRNDTSTAATIAANTGPLDYLAACCSAAVEFIQSIENARAPGVPEVPPLQVENVLSSFASKLMQLGMFELALKELMKLKDRLAEAMMRSTDKESWMVQDGEKTAPSIKTAAAIKEDSKLEIERVAKLLEFTKVAPGSSAFPLAVAYQIMAIRCIAGMKRPELLEALAPSLSSLHNPLSLVKTLAKSSASKAASHIASLTQVLAASTPSTSPSADTTALNPELSCSPRAALTLQILILECTALKKAIQPEDSTNSKDPWQLFGNFLAAYVRRTTASNAKRERYIAVRDSAEMARRIIEGKDARTMPSDVYKLLSWSAADAGLNKEAMRWTEEWQRVLEASEDPTDSALVVLCKVRLATMQFRGAVPRQSDSITSGLEAVEELERRAQHAADGLANVTRGRKQDFDFVLQEVASLRRAALGLLAVLLREFNLDVENGRKEKDEGETKQRLKAVCDRITKSIICFCRKYLAMTMSDGDKTRAQPLLVSTIDTALSSCWRGFEVNSPAAWTELEALLGECGAAVKVLESDESESLDPAYYERVSNAYWQIHLLYKKKSGGEREAVRALRRSISVLEGRSAQELEHAHIALKWERLGGIFMAAGDYRSAEEAFLKAMQVFLNTGVLKVLGERASRGEPVSKIIDASDKGTASIARIIAGLVHLAKRKKDDVAAELRFDFKGLTLAARGFLLEWTLNIAIGVMGSDGSIARIVGERLLEVYPIEEMPIRRGRVVATLLGMAVDRAGLFDKEEVMGLGKETTEWAESVTPLYLAYDGDLNKYKEDVVASCLVSLAFCHWQEGTAKPELMQSGLTAWNGILEASPDWDGLVQRVENPEELPKRLGMVVEFCEMKGEVELKVAALKVLVRLRELESPSNYDALVGLHSTLGLQYLRLGYSGKAGICLATAQALLKKAQESVTTVTQLQWNLAYTEYLVTIGNTEKGTGFIDAASKLVEADQELQNARESGARVSKRVTINRAIADAAYVASLMSFEKGHINESLMNARRSVRLNQRAWAGLESLNKDIPASGFAKDADELAKGISSLAITARPKIHTTTHAALNLPSLWSLVSAMYLSCLQAATVYRHLGMSREAAFFTEQALKTVEAVKAHPTIARAKIMLADLMIRSGQTEEGENALENIGKLGDQGMEYIEYELALANLERVSENYDAEREAYGRAEQRLDELADIKRIEGLGRLDEETELTDQMSQMEISKSKSKSKSHGRPKTPVKRKGGAAISAVISKLTSPAKPSSKLSAVAGECSALLRQKAQIQRLRAYSLAVCSQYKEAVELLEQAAKIPSGQQGYISQGLVEANQLLHKALALAASDPVFSVLQDSTISLPSISITSLDSDMTASPVKKAPRKATASAKQAKAFIEVLQQARDRIFKIHERAVKMGSASASNSVTSSLARIVVLLSAMTSARGRGPEHPLFASYTLELNKGQPMLRERLALVAEKVVASTKEDLSWPQPMDPRARPALLDSTPFDFVSFREEYVDIIPKQWIAVSISLSEKQDELYVSRFRAGENQLMVRLPLTRHNSRDDYQELFEYSDGVSGLAEIISAANESTHEAKSMKDMEKRAQWWARREELDNELKGLLDNIEHVWLGGFRGILCQYSRNLSLFSRFRASFDKILAKHLPSRRKKTKGKVEIDYRILELFIALGNPEGQDLEEALLDLLYFVVDILQFHGEGNAYDEIDMDSMVVEMTDVLISYHEEAARRPEAAQTDVDHTILILDKSLQQFPWESLPCLRGSSISRLPSLAALRERILASPPTTTSLRPGHYVVRTSGAYVLNPSRDLARTQDLFEAPLAELPGTWDRIVAREPSEDEFAAALAGRDLLLYFGHGSGAHYIPPKRVRRLERCAVACLMGCSSGAMREAGEYESWGTPANYLLAGCPAVLANLWDVTDKDIDGFMMEVLAEWGLVEKRRSKEKGPKSVNAKGAKSLVEAVAGARDKCRMAYLNGAAPVVYGIPAYLK